MELKAFKSNITLSDIAPNVNKLYLWTERGATEATDYEITLDMAKQLAMLQKSEKGE